MPHKMSSLRGLEVWEMASWMKISEREDSWAIYSSGFHTYLESRKEWKGHENNQLEHLGTKPNVRAVVNKNGVHKFGFRGRKLPFRQQKRS